jgi:hypothetical protein
LDCDGSSQDVISNRQCHISLETLRAAPFNLVKDQSVFVKIVSTNVYGDSVQSAEFNGAVIQLVPDAPLSFSNVVVITDANQVGLIWAEGDNGGTPVIDWRVWYALLDEVY